METPWINCKRMLELSLNQVSIYKSLGVPEKSTSLLNEEKEMAEPDCSSETEELESREHTVISNEKSVNKSEPGDYDKTANSKKNIDVNFEEGVPTQINIKNNVEQGSYGQFQNSKFENNHLKNSDHTNEYEDNLTRRISSLSRKSPFRAIVEIDDFLHSPIFGNTSRSSYQFLDIQNGQKPELDSNLFSTEADYPEPPYCRLVHSNVHESIYFANSNDFLKKPIQNVQIIAVPVHEKLNSENEILSLKTDEPFKCIHIYVPVVVGEYKIEIGLDESLLFPERVLQIKEISNQVILKDCQFKPLEFSRMEGNGIYKAIRGNLFLEGEVHQLIEFTIPHNHNSRLARQSWQFQNKLQQKMVLDLFVHVLQLQHVRF